MKGYYDDKRKEAECVAKIERENKLMQEALKKIAAPMPGSRENELVMYYERTAQQALKRLEDME